jgi:hypothetical protein
MFYSSTSLQDVLYIDFKYISLLQLVYLVLGGFGSVKIMKINHSVKGGLIEPILQEKHKKCCFGADCGD